MTRLAREIRARTNAGGLNEAALDALLQDIAQDRAVRDLAWRYGVTQATVQRIVREAARHAIRGRDRAHDGPSPVLVLAMAQALAARLDRLCERVEQLRATAPAAPPRELTAQEQQILEVVRAHGPIAVPDVARRLDTTGSNVRRILRALRGRGLVGRHGTTNGARYTASAREPAGEPPEDPEPSPDPAPETPAAPRTPTPSTPKADAGGPPALTENEANVLRALIKAPSALPPELASRSGLAVNRVGELIGALKRKGYVETWHGGRRVRRLPSGERMPERRDDLQAQVEAHVQSGNVTRGEPVRAAGAADSSWEDLSR